MHESVDEADVFTSSVDYAVDDPFACFTDEPISGGVMVEEMTYVDYPRSARGDEGSKTFQRTMSYAIRGPDAEFKYGTT